MAQSVTVKISADTKNFIRELKKADNQIRATQKVATNLEKSLDLKFDATRATEAQKQFQQALDQTEAKAENVRNRLKALEEAGRIDSVDYSTLELELAKTESKAEELKNKLEELKNVQIEQLSKKFTDVGDKITKAGQQLAGVSLAAAGAITGVAAIGKTAAATGAEIDDLSQRFNVSAETIQRWQYLALQGGVDIGVFNKALIRMRAAMADMAAGTSNKATDVMTALGLSPDQFSTQEEMFDGIIAALAKVEDSTLQTAYANEIFGDKIATQMLPYINAGAEDLAKWNAEFEAMPSLTSEEAASLALLDDTFNRLNITMKNASAELGLAFAPIIERIVVFIEEKLVPAIESLADWFSGLSPGMQDAILGFMGIMAVAAPLLILIGKISKGIGVLIPVLKLLTNSARNSALSFGALFASVSLVFGIIANWDNMNAIQRTIAIIGTLTAAVLGAAVAFGVFHSSWSLGAAAIGIVAGISAAVAAINSAKDSIEQPQIDDFDADEYSNMITNGAAESSNIPYQSSGGSGYTDNSYVSNDTINITVNGTNLSAEEIADAVSRKIATTKQVRG
nr:MAG TPA: tail tape measure [Caudoviricetes sp.]